MTAHRLTVVLLLSLLGCVPTATVTPPRGAIVAGPPPAPLAEERPPPQGASSVWMPGYWHWTGTDYAWIPGHWEAAPPGQTPYRSGPP
jgi:hypothetical protein